MTFILACLTATSEGFLKRKKHKCLERRQHDPGETGSGQGRSKRRGGGGGQAASGEKCARGRYREVSFCIANNTVKTRK